MKNLLSPKRAAHILIIIFIAIVVFHLLVIAGVVPSTIVWGGNLQDRQQLLIMESVSILLNLLMLAIACIYAGLIKISMNSAVLRALFWIMFVLFVLNTIGNLNAKTSLETYIFTPITFLLAILCFRIAAFGFAKP